MRGDRYSSPADGLQVSRIGQARGVIVRGREVAVVFRRGSRLVRSRARVWPIGVFRRRRCRYYRRQGRGGVALEVHVHAEADGGLESARINGRAHIIVVDSPDAALRAAHTGVYLRPGDMSRGARRGLGYGRILRVSEASIVSEQVPPAVAEGSPVLLRRSVVVFVRRSIQILQRYRVVRVVSAVVGVGEGHLRVRSGVLRSTGHLAAAAQLNQMLSREHADCKERGIDA